LGKLLELLLTPVGISVQCEVQIVSDPPRLDILLLRRDGEQWDSRQLPLSEARCGITSSAYEVA
jgi:hypothetical protein